MGPASTVKLTAPQSYAQQLAQAAYQQKMAEALQAQADAPIDIQSYKGIQAPIPWTAALAKALESYGGNVMQKRALETQAKAETLAQSNMMDALAGATPQAPAGPGATDTMSARNAPSAETSAQSNMMDLLNAGANPPAPGATGGAAPSDAGPPAPTPQAPPVADNPMDPQAASQNARLAQAFQGNAPPPQAMFPASAPPMPQPPQALQSNAPPPQAMPPANAGLAQAPQGNAPPPAPPTTPTPPISPPTTPAALPNVYNEALSQHQAKLLRFQNLANSPLIGPTQRAQLGSMIDYEQKQIETLTTEKLKADSEANNKQANLSSINNAIDSLTGVPPEIKATMHALTASNPEGAKEYFTVIAQNALKPHEHWATPTELQAAGIPLGSAVQINDQTGAANILVNYHTTQIEDQNLAATEANARTAQGHLALDRQMLQIAQAREARMASAGLNEQEQTALDTAVAEGRLDPMRLNSRNAKVQAQILLHNPGANFVNSHAIAVMTANPAFQSKALIAGALPEVLQNVRDAGKKLNFSTVSYLGKLQAFKNNTLNDPDFVEYMSQRADAMQTVSNVMRASGATEQSIKAETKAAPITMSPEAFDGWYAGQMKSLAPRISRMTPLTIQSSRAAPPPAAPPAAPITKTINGITYTKTSNGWVQ